MSPNLKTKGGMLLTLYRFITLCCGLFVCWPIRCLCVTKLPDRGDGILDCSQHCIIRLPSALPLRRNRYGVRAYCKVPKHTSTVTKNSLFFSFFLHLSFMLLEDSPLLRSLVVIFNHHQNCTTASLHLSFIFLC